MAKRKRREDRLPLHKEKLCKTESVKAVNGNNHSIHEEIATPTTNTPMLNSHPIFVLDQASLNIGFVHKKRKILWDTEDCDFLLKKGKNPKDYRPDILYRALCEVLDSTLNKKGRVGAVFVKTDSGVLFEVKPHVRIPRTMKRFCGLMLELLDKSCIRAKESGEVLLRVLKGSLTQHLPENALMIGLTHSSPKIVDINHYLSAANNDSVLCFVVGAMAKGKVNKDGMDDYISVSNLPLSARYCVAIICQVFEDKWKACESKSLLERRSSVQGQVEGL